MLMLHNKDNSKGFECIWIISNLFEDNEERDLIMSKTVREIAELMGVSSNDLVKEKQRIESKLR